MLRPVSDAIRQPSASGVDPADDFNKRLDRSKLNRSAPSPTGHSLLTRKKVAYGVAATFVALLAKNALPDVDAPNRSTWATRHRQHQAQRIANAKAKTKMAIDNMKVG